MYSKLLWVALALCPTLLAVARAERDAPEPQTSTGRRIERRRPVIV
jgi:hypothetical protein